MSRRSVAGMCICFDFMLLIILVFNTIKTIESGFRITYLFELITVAVFIVIEAAYFRSSKTADGYVVFAALLECFGWCGADAYIAVFTEPTKEGFGFGSLPAIMSWWKWVFPAAVILFHFLAYFPAKSVAAKANINKSEEQKQLDGEKGGLYGVIGCVLGGCVMHILFALLKNSPAGSFAMLTIVICIAEFGCALAVETMLLVRKRIRALVTPG